LPLPGVRGRPQRLPSAGSGRQRLLLLPPAAPVQLRLLLYMQMGDKNLIIIN